jgi:hypothetical protein
MPNRGLIVKVLISAFILSFSHSLPAYAESTPPCYVSSGSVITGSGTCAGDILIGSEITSIGIAAFKNNLSLTSIVIPPSVITIGAEAFKNTRITNITFQPGSQLTSMGEKVFEEAVRLTSVTIPDFVTSIPLGAFANATSLRSITIPSSVTSIGEYAFQGATSLNSVSIPSGVSVIPRGAFYGASSLTSISIPPSVSSLGEYAFAGASSLSSIIFPGTSQLETIGGSAFNNATSLQSINLPSSVRSIGPCAFEGTSLVSIVIPEMVTSISDGLFRSVESLVSVTLSSGTTSIGENSFSHTSISSITIPNSVTTIGTGAFAYNSKLTSIIIPEGVTSLGSAAFENATNLNSVKLPDSLLVLESALFFGATALTKFTFPKNLVRVGSSVFGYTSITAVVVPPSVEQIDQFAFAFMPELKTAIIQSGVKRLLYGVFAFDPSLTTVVIPNSATSIGYPFEMDQSEQVRLYGFGTSDPDERSGFRTIFEGDDNLKCATYPTVSFLGGYNLMESFGDVSRCQKSAIGTSVASGSRLATLASTDYSPALALSFDTTTAIASVTVVPWSNPAPLSTTPFTVSSSTKIIDIQVSGSIAGPLTLCLDGAPTDHLFHFSGTPSAWKELPSRTYVGGQVCGITTSFSPFAVVPQAAVAEAARVAAAQAAAAEAARVAAAQAAAAEAARVAAAQAEAQAEAARVASAQAIAAEAARVAAARAVAAEAARLAAEIKAAEVAKAKSDLKNILQSDGKPSLDTFKAAGIEGITQKNVEKVSEKILTLPVEQRSNPVAIEKMITVVTFFDPQTPPTIADFANKGIGTVTTKIVSKVANELLTVPESQQGDVAVIKQIVQRVATVDKLSTPETSKSVQAADLVAINALSNSNTKKVTITSALKKLDPSSIDTFQEVLAEIAKQEAIIKARAEKTAAIKAKLAARSSKP